MKNNRENKMSLNSKGLTLIELVAVLIILGIIAAIAIPTIGNVIENAREDVQIINMRNIHNYIESEMELNPFDDDSFYTYKKSSSADDTYFSIFLETTWEVKNGPGDADNTNVLNLTNSLSGKYGVVNWTDAPGLGDDLYCNQSLYITTDSDASYDVNNPTTIDSCYAGSIVIWYDDTSADNIIIFFVDNDGLQSDTYFIYSRED